MGLYIFWMMQPFSNTSRKNAPGMLCWVDVGDLAGQFITMIHMSSVKVMDSCVGTCIILH